MELSTKPDFDRVKRMWEHFWAGDLLGRPPVVAAVNRPGCNPPYPGHQRYQAACEGRYQDVLDRIDAHLAGTEYLAEAVPFFAPDHGPDQFAAFLGGQLTFSPDSPNTNWVAPWVDDWDDVLPIRLDESNPTWRSALAFSRALAQHRQGRYLVGVCDLHSNMDALLAMRGAERLAMDFYDCPERIVAAMDDVRKLYAPIYQGLYEAGGMGEQDGTIGWVPFWSPGRFATIQCDFLCMLSPEMARRSVMPALAEEASYLDHCTLHFDGPGALPHLDDVLAIDAIDAIQWVPGAGQPPMHTWCDVLRRCPEAGKALQIYGVGPDEVRQLHKELRPDKVAYCVSVRDRQQCQDLLDWLEANT